MKVLLALSMVLFPVVANAQGLVCDKDITSLDTLLQENTPTEKPTYAGITDGKNALVFYKSEKGENWAVIITRQDGVSCIVATGTKWHTLPKNQPPEKGTKQ